MVRDLRSYLFDIKKSITDIRSYAPEASLEVLQGNRLIRAGIEREFIIIGEALSQLYKLSPEVAQQVEDWKEIIAFRNVLVHGYFKLNLEVIWKAVQFELPKLEAKIDELLQSL